MSRTKIIQLNNKKIIFCNFRNIERQEILTISQQAWSLFRKELPKNEKASLLVDLTNVNIPPKIMEEIASMVSHYKKHINKQGLIGIQGITKALIDVHSFVNGSDLKTFKNKEKAMLWAAS